MLLTSQIPPKVVPEVGARLSDPSMEAIRTSDPPHPRLTGARRHRLHTAPASGSSTTQPQDRRYDLRLDAADSDQYFDEIREFCDRWMVYAEHHVASLLDAYSAHAQSFLRELPRGRAEYALDLLTLGLSLRHYAEAAQATPRWAMEIATELEWTEQRAPRMRPALDFVRMILLRSCFFRHGSRPARRAGWLHQLPRLSLWMHSRGDFQQVSMRLNNWRSFFRSQPEIQAENSLQKAVDFFDWFQAEAHVALGVYTQGAMPSSGQSLNRLVCREQRIFCERSAVESHMGMVAAEVLNRGLAQRFEQSTRRILLVPACMRGTGNGACNARIEGMEITCSMCQPQCTLGQLTRRMHAEGVAVYLIPRDIGFEHWLERWQREPGLGIAAVSCLTALLESSLEARARRMVAQVLPLDHSGCQALRPGSCAPAAVNADQLVRIVTAGENRRGSDLAIPS